ncbi:MAG: PAS domain-containing protein [Methanospirillaceae archaeon]|nr:PAS domain-containing protein [Methanospirillaceae archaeon]
MSDDEQQSAGPVLTDTENSSTKNGSSHISAALWSSGLGCWEMNVADKRLVLDHHISFILGNFDAGSLSLTEFIGTYVHPEEQERIWEAFLQVEREDAEEMLIEFRLRSGEGGYIWVLMRGDITRYTREGEPEKISGTLEDITRIREIRSTPMYLASAISANRREIWESFLLLLKNKHLFHIPVFFSILFGLYAGILLSTGYLDNLIHSDKGVGPVELLLLYISYLFYYFLKAGIIHAGWAAMHAKKESLADTISSLRPCSLSIALWAGIMMVFALVMVTASEYAEDIGLLVCAIFGSFFFLFTYFVVTVLICEKNNVLYAIIRSYEVFKKTRAIGVVGIIYFAVLLIPGIVYLIFINSWKNGDIMISMDPATALAVSSASGLVTIILLGSVVFITIGIIIFILGTYIMNQLYITLLYRDEESIAHTVTGPFHKTLTSIRLEQD